MKLQQLRYLCAVVDQGFNVTAAAQTLFTSQPEVSKQIRQLEPDFGVEILFHQGNRIVGLTDPGRELVSAAQRLLIDSQEMQKIAAGYFSADSCSLRVDTTHLHARYPLLPVIRAFSIESSDRRLNEPAAGNNRRAHRPYRASIDGTACHTTRRSTWPSPSC